MKVALYARVSDPKEKRGTIESQIDALQAFARENGHEVVDSYVCRDRYTGVELARPELDRLRDGAEAGAFEAVLVYDPDRLSRKYVYQILIMEEFERLGIPMIFLNKRPPDDPSGVLLVQIQGAVAEYERAKIVERYRRGKLYRARQGEVFWNSIPYGYRRIPRRDAMPAHLVVDEAQADVVRQIFAWHADTGMSIRQVAHRLTREGYPTPKGGEHWGETTVHRILRREAYLGVLYYNRSVSTLVQSSDGGAPQRKRVARPVAEQITISIPALIDREVFERSQARHERNQRFSPRNLHEEQWLLRRLLRCGRCGLKCHCVADKRRPHMPPSYYYRCGPPRLPGHPICHPSHARAHPLDALVWNEVRKHLLQPNLLLRAHMKAPEPPMLDSSLLSSQIENAQRRLRCIGEERRRLLDAYQYGFLEKKEFEDRASTVARRTEMIRKEIQALQEGQRDASEGRKLLERLQDFTSVATRRLDTMRFSERQALVRTVIEQVVLSGNIVHIYFKIPLPKPSPSGPEIDGVPGTGALERPHAGRLSSRFDLRSRADQSMGMGIEVGPVAPEIMF